MQNAGQYGPGAASAHPPTQFVPSEPSPNGGSTTSSLRQFRKKDVDKNQVEQPQQPSKQMSESHVARVAPHTHYPPTGSNEIYRYPTHQFPGYNPQVKYSDLADSSQTNPISTSVIQKPKSKDYMEMCNVQQQHLNNHQQFSPDTGQYMHKDPAQGYSTGFKPESHYFPKDQAQYQQLPHHPAHPKFTQMMNQNMRKYNPAPADNPFLNKLSKIHPSMARSIMSDHHLQDGPQSTYPPMDQRGMYGQQNHRYYSGSMHQPNPYSNNSAYPMNTPHPYSNYSAASCNYSRSPQMGAMPSRYPLMERSLSPSRRGYPEGMHMPHMNYHALHQKIPPGHNFSAQYRGPEYAQHYQHRRMPQDCFPQSCRPPQYMQGHHQISGQDMQELAENTVSPSDSLKKFIENWADEESSASEIIPMDPNMNLREKLRDDAPPGTVYMINANDVQYFENNGIPIVTSDNGGLQLTSENYQYLVKTGLVDNGGMVRIIEANKEISIDSNGNQERIVNLQIMEAPKSDCMLVNKHLHPGEAQTRPEDENRRVVIHQNTILNSGTAVSQDQTSLQQSVVDNLSITKELVDKNCSPINLDHLEHNLEFSDAELTQTESNCSKAVSRNRELSLNHEDLSQNSDDSHYKSPGSKSMPIIDFFGEPIVESEDAQEEASSDQIVEKSIHEEAIDMLSAVENTKTSTSLIVTPDSSKSETITEYEAETIADEDKSHITFEETTSGHGQAPAERKKRIFSVDDIIHHIGNNVKRGSRDYSYTSETTADFIEKETEFSCLEQIDLFHSKADVKIKSNTIKVEGSFVVLEVAGEVMEISVNTVNGRKVISVTPLSKSTVVDYNDNYEVFANSDGSSSRNAIEDSSEEMFEDNTENIIKREISDPSLDIVEETNQPMDVTSEELQPEDKVLIDASSNDIVEESEIENKNIDQSIVEETNQPMDVTSEERQPEDKELIDASSNDIVEESEIENRNIDQSMDEGMNTEEEIVENPAENLKDTVTKENIAEKLDVFSEEQVEAENEKERVSSEEAIKENQKNELPEDQVVDSPGSINDKNDDSMIFALSVNNDIVEEKIAEVQDTDEANKEVDSPCKQAISLDDRGEQVERLECSNVDINDDISSVKEKTGEIISNINSCNAVEEDEQRNVTTQKSRKESDNDILKDEDLIGSVDGNILIKAPDENNTQEKNSFSTPEKRDEWNEDIPKESNENVDSEMAFEEKATFIEETNEHIDSSKPDNETFNGIDTTLQNVGNMNISTDADSKDTECYDMPIQNHEINKVSDEDSVERDLKLENRIGAVSENDDRMKETDEEMKNLDHVDEPITEGQFPNTMDKMDNSVEIKEKINKEETILDEGSSAKNAYESSQRVENVELKNDETILFQAKNKYDLAESPPGNEENALNASVGNARSDAVEDDINSSQSDKTAELTVSSEETDEEMNQAYDFENKLDKEDKIEPSVDLIDGLHTLEDTLVRNDPLLVEQESQALPEATSNPNETVERRIEEKCIDDHEIEELHSEEEDEVTKFEVVEEHPKISITDDTITFQNTVSEKFEIEVRNSPVNNLLPDDHLKDTSENIEELVILNKDEIIDHIDHDSPAVIIESEACFLLTHAESDKTTELELDDHNGAIEKEIIGVESIDSEVEPVNIDIDEEHAIYDLEDEVFIAEPPGHEVIVSDPLEGIGVVEERLDTPEIPLEPVSTTKEFFCESFGPQKIESDSYVVMLSDQEKPSKELKIKIIKPEVQILSPTSTNIEDHLASKNNIYLEAAGIDNDASECTVPTITTKAAKKMYESDLRVQHDIVSSSKKEEVQMKKSRIKRSKRINEKIQIKNQQKEMLKILAEKRRRRKELKLKEAQKEREVNINKSEEKSVEPDDEYVDFKELLHARKLKKLKKLQEAAAQEVAKINPSIVTSTHVREKKLDKQQNACCIGCGNEPIKKAKTQINGNQKVTKASKLENIGHHSDVTKVEISKLQNRVSISDETPSSTSNPMDQPPTNQPIVSHAMHPKDPRRKARAFTNQVIVPSVSELIEENNVSVGKKKISLADYVSRKRKATCTNDDKMKRHKLDSTGCERTDSVESNADESRNTVVKHRSLNDVKTSFVIHSSDWEDSNSPAPTPRHSNEEDYFMEDFSGLINNNNSKKPVIDVNELTPMENPKDRKLQEYKEKVDSQLSSLNIQILKAKSHSSPNSTLAQCSSPKSGDLIRRFLNNEKLSQIDMEEIRKIISYKRSMLHQKSSKRCDKTVNSNDCHETKLTSCETATDSNEARLNFKRLGTKRKSSQIFSENEEILPNDHKKKNAGYSVFNRLGEDGLPKIIFKRNKRHNLTKEPVVELVKLNLDDLEKVKEKYNVTVRQS